MSHRRNQRVLGLAGLMAAVTLCGAAAAAVPEPVPYVGELLFADGTPVDAQVDLEVALYASEAGPQLLWGPFNYSSVDVASGVFSLLLGDLDTAPVDTALLGSDQVWVEFSLNGVLLTPRQRLYAVPYARVSADTDALGGVEASSYVVESDLGAVATSNSYDDLSGRPAAFVDIQNEAGASQIIADESASSVRVRGAGATTVDFDAAAREIIISSTDGGGDITAVNAGAGLTGGAANGDATLALATPSATSLGGVMVSSCGAGDVVTGIDASGMVVCAPDANSGGTVNSVGATGPLTSTGGANPVISLDGVVDASHGGTGLSTPGNSGQFLRSNGSDWQSTGIQAGDIPSGSTHYIRNQTGSTQSGGFNVGGSGRTGGDLTVSGGTLALDSSGSNQITYANAGVAAPSANSAGWKIRTWGTDYGVGIDSSTQWYSSANHHRWYSTDGTTWTEQMHLNNSGRLRLYGALFADEGNDTASGIRWANNIAGGTGDTAYIRYYVVDGEQTRLVIANENDSNDEIVLRGGGSNSIFIDREFTTFRTAMTMHACPGGWTLDNGVCWDWRSAWGDQTWSEAQATCAALGSHVCTYADSFLTWGPDAQHQIHFDGDWLGDFVGDDEVLVVNNSDTINNFEGSANKNDEREFVCCITAH